MKVCGPSLLLGRRVLAGEASTHDDECHPPQEASSANGDGHMDFKQTLNQAPPPELPTLPSQLLAYRGQDQPQGYTHQEALPGLAPMSLGFPFPLGLLPQSLLRLTPGSAGKCFINCKARHNREFLKTTFQGCCDSSEGERHQQLPGQSLRTNHTPWSCGTGGGGAGMTGNGRAGLQRPFPAVTQPPQSRLGRERRRAGRDGKPPQAVQGPQSWLEVQS